MCVSTRLTFVLDQNDVCDRPDGVSCGSFKKSRFSGVSAPPPPTPPCTKNQFRLIRVGLRCRLLRPLREHEKPVLPDSGGASTPLAPTVGSSFSESQDSLRNLKFETLDFLGNNFLIDGRGVCPCLLPLPPKK